MHPTEFLKDAKELVDSSFTIMEQANAEYASDADKFENFKTIAAFLGTVNPRLAQLQPEDVALIYFMKHLSSIIKGISNRESMDGRYADAINYLLLHRGIVGERERDKPETVNPVYKVPGVRTHWMPTSETVARAMDEVLGDSEPVLSTYNAPVPTPEVVDAREGTGNEDFVPGSGVVPVKPGVNPWQ